uniref:Uncharacterized protein n=1 Tax=Desertifilum tharense IPPAS B-1220 TaxID=1781255 RepID=A0ACD5GRG9_9CYAN
MGFLFFIRNQDSQFLTSTTLPNQNPEPYSTLSSPHLPISPSPHLPIPTQHSALSTQH